MRSEEYRRLHEVCCEMALRSDSKNLQDRWLKMAQVWLDRANDPNNIQLARIVSLDLDQHEAAPVSSGSLAIN
jgi:hypothetical protein